MTSLLLNVLLVLLLIQVSVCDGFKGLKHPSPRLVSKQCRKPETHRQWSRVQAHVGAEGAIASKLSIASTITPGVFGGLLSGGLHAITGPDHLAALLPSSVGKSGWYGAKIGAIWGLGHGLSATILGLCAFLLKDQLSSRLINIEKWANFAESTVGASLVFIGVLGIKESMEKEEEVEAHTHTDTNAAESGNREGKKVMSSGAIFANGMLHGFSLDGAPSLAPAVVMSSWQKASLFLSAYSVGTMIAMSLAAGGIGLVSTRLGKIANRPDLPKKLSFVSSLIALLIGVYWVVQPFL